MEVDSLYFFLMEYLLNKQKGEKIILKDKKEW